MIMKNYIRKKLFQFLNPLIIQEIQSEISLRENQINPAVVGQRKDFTDESISQHPLAGATDEEVRALIRSLE